MKKALVVTLFLAVFGVLTACKLAVIVVEGGEVQSNATGTCVAGTICMLDVKEPEFSETFTAVPYEGWYFKEWNKGHRFFCQNHFVTTCSLSFEGYENSEEVYEMVASSETFYVMPVFKPYQDVVIANGMEWLQPALFTDLSWNDISAACPEGECSGFLNGYDVTGWTWASVDDITQLFNSYIALSPTGRSPLGPTTDVYVEPSRAKWAAAFLGDGWLETNESVGVWGLTRSLIDESTASVALTYFDADTSDECCSGLPDDIFLLGREQAIQSKDSNIGAWLYRHH